MLLKLATKYIWPAHVWRSQMPASIQVLHFSCTKSLVQDLKKQNKKLLALILWCSNMHCVSSILDQVDPWTCNVFDSPEAYWNLQLYTRQQLIHKPPCSLINKSSIRGCGGSVDIALTSKSRLPMQQSQDQIRQPSQSPEGCHIKRLCSVYRIVSRKFYMLLLVPLDR
jgi:hypothetical protein